ncbi:DUF1566 domain-containing protein [Polaromonas sp. CT11-55]|uniref:Lcl C-terminal domain-containing protein n=1 Tax=Polaromonas sp. CT11-55 TaxID=3243045 RepID=UPI0039A73B73
MHRLSFRTLGFALLLLSSAGISLAQDRFTPSADGQEVTDSRTGLIWKRCAEGMVFKGKTCTGQAVFMNHPDAAARAKAASAPDAEWRMPILKELSSIVSAREAEENKAAIDPNAFPATPVARFWTSSSTGPGYFTFVGFSDGSAGEAPRATSAAVRLVRGGK